MSGYTIGEIGVWLLLAAALGFVLGWLVRELVLRSRQPAVTIREIVAAEVATAPEPALEAEAVAGPEPEPEPEPEPSAEPEPEAEPAPAVVPGPHPGSALPLAGGAPPSDEYVVKVSRGSKIYHAASSPAFARTTAALWFTSAEAAERAGLRRPKNG